MRCQPDCGRDRQQSDAVEKNGANRPTKGAGLTQTFSLQETQYLQSVQ